MIILSAKLATVMPSLECSVYIKELPAPKEMVFFLSGGWVTDDIFLLAKSASVFFSYLARNKNIETQKLKCFQPIERSNPKTLSKHRGNFKSQSQHFSYHELLYDASQFSRVVHLPKCVRLSKVAQFWKAEIILHKSYKRYFFLNLCLEVASLIQTFALSKRDQCISKHSLLR